MSDTTRLAKTSGVAKNDDVNRLRAIVQMNVARAGASQVGIANSHGSIHRQSEGFKTKAYSNSTAFAPWFLTGTVDGSDLKIYIKPGMVNNFVPTIGGTSLVSISPPAITVTGSSGVIQLKATIDAAGSITALIAESVSSITSDTSTNKYKLVGTWTATGGAFTSVTSILNTNQAFYLCGSTAIWEA